MTNAAGTCYWVVPSRTRAQTEAFLGKYSGVLVSDCLNVHDDLTPIQQKCYAHHLKCIGLKRIGAALDGPEAGSAYLADLRALLLGAMALKESAEALPADRMCGMR